MGYLQSDATTAYEVGHDPSAQEVQAATPYSTYSNPACPRRPFAHRALIVLQAVCAPQKRLRRLLLLHFLERRFRKAAVSIQPHV